MSITSRRHGLVKSVRMRIYVSDDDDDFNFRGPGDTLHRSIFVRDGRVVFYFVFRFFRFLDRAIISIKCLDNNLLINSEYDRVVLLRFWTIFPLPRNSTPGPSAGRVGRFPGPECFGRLAAVPSVMYIAHYCFKTRAVRPARIHTTRTDGNFFRVNFFFETFLCLI